MLKSIHNDAYKTLIESLIDERKRQGLTMRDLADRLGVVHTFVYKIEKCERNLSLQEFIQYTIALEIDFDKLLEEFAKNMKKEDSINQS